MSSGPSIVSIDATPVTRRHGIRPDSSRTERRPLYCTLECFLSSLRTIWPMISRLKVWLTCPTATDPSVRR